jgi:hypothetical protein
MSAMRIKTRYKCIGGGVMTIFLTQITADDTQICTDFLGLGCVGLDHNKSVVICVKSAVICVKNRTNFTMTLGATAPLLTPAIERN